MFQMKIIILDLFKLQSCIVRCIIALESNNISERDDYL